MLEQALQALLDLGPVGILVVLVISGYLVPKPYYEREVRRADTATDATEKTAEALKTVVETVKTVGESNKESLRILTDKITAIEAIMRAK